jgi:hypothetical protein
MTNRNQTARYLPQLVAIAVFGLILLIVFPLTQRSLWVDETMLLVNFPLTWGSLLKPLPEYGQAGSLLHNLLLSIFGNLDVEVLRLGSFLLVAGGCLLAWGFFRKPPVESVIGGLAVLGLFTLLFYATEIKHYGFEILGAALAITWYINKDRQKALAFPDLLILLASLLLGISTIVITVIALSLYLIEYFWKERRLPLPTLAYSAGFFLASLGYFLLIKSTTRLQLQTYAQIYDIDGPKALMHFVLAIPMQLSLIPATAFTGALLLVYRRRPEVARFLLLSGLVFSTFLALSFVGEYPVRWSRHLAWTAAFLGTAFFLVIEAASQSGSWRKYVLAFLSLLFLIPAWTTVTVLTDKSASLAYTDNSKAIEWLCGQPPSNVGLWYGAESAIQYYSRHQRCLGRHDYFGKIHVDPEAIRERSPPEVLASDLLMNAPRGQSFLIFASHMNIDEKHGYWRALKSELDKHSCNYTSALEVKKAFLLSANCP